MARALLAALEREASLTLGVARVCLTTGTAQPEAVALYESSGYRAVPGYGEFADLPVSRSYAKNVYYVWSTDVTPHALWTRRLHLRPPGPDDAGAVLRLYQSSGEVHDPGVEPLDEAAARRRLAGWARHWERHGVGYWAVRRRDRPAVLGFCGVIAMTLDARPVWDLSCRLDPDARGRGFASEAAAGVGMWVRAHVAQRPVVARVRPGDVAGARVALAAGLTRAPDLDVVTQDGRDEVHVLPATVTA